MSQYNLDLVNFPAVIKLHADDELMLIANKFAFENDHNLTNMYFQPQDILIDSRGHVFNIQKAERLYLLKADDILPLDEIIKLVKLHLSNHGACCISKFSADSIEDALNCL
jgi:hypothetical protein